MTRLVFTHAFAEEAVLFAAARRVLSDGDPLTLHIENEHQDVNQLMAAVDSSTDRDNLRPVLLHRAFASLEEDVCSEEDRLLPRLQQLLSPRQLRRLGWQCELVRRIAPTRPHRAVARRPPGQTLSALPLSILDRSRDQLQRIDELTRGRFSTALPAADRWLARAAGAVERGSVFQRGERPKTAVDNHHHVGGAAG